MSLDMTATLTETERREDLLHTLRLIHAPRIGPVTFRKLIRVFGSAQAALAAPLERLMEVPDFKQGAAEAVRSASRDSWAEEELERAAQRGIRLLSLKDPSYPKLLLNTYDPPPVLYVQGVFHETDALAIGIVGARTCTQYGRTQAERLSGDLTAAGFTIVSGLARGIDTAAHTSAVSLPNGRTLAVLGNGLGTVYPSENRRLHDRILDGHGAVFSELPLDTPPAAEHFPRRNRIIAGLSLGVVIVEGRESSGAMITARYAIDMDREVFAIPGLVGSPNARGPHRLIKQGAKLVEDVEDILEEIREVAEPLVRMPAHDSRLRLPRAEKEPDSTPLFQSLDKKEPRPQGDKRPDLSDLRARNLSERENKVYQILDDQTAYGVDHIILKSGLKPQEVLAILLVLEVRRLCKQLPGKRFLKV